MAFAFLVTNDTVAYSLSSSSQPSFTDGLVDSEFTYEIVFRLLLGKKLKKGPKNGHFRWGTKLTAKTVKRTVYYWSGPFPVAETEEGLNVFD